MQVHVLLYKIGHENEGIHSLEIKEKTLVLMFEELDDAERYCGLLEAQDFPKPIVEKVDKFEIEEFCSKAGYEARFVEKGFIPNSQEDLLYISPPQSNLDVSEWDKQDNSNYDKTANNEVANLENIKRKLEDLL